MDKEKKIEKEKNQYKIIYEIALEENQLLRERCAVLQQEYIRLIEQQNTTVNSHHSIFYRAARKLYRMIKKR